MDARPPCLQGHFQPCYCYHTHFTAGTRKCKRSACYCWMHCWPYPISFIENCVIFLKQANHKTTAEICGKPINPGSGLGLELPVIYKIYGRRRYLDRLDELILGSENVKRALREKDEGILIDGQKKRKLTKKDKYSLKKQKK